MPLICPTCQVFAQRASVPATACYFAWGGFRYFRLGATATWRRPLRAAQFLKPPALPGDTYFFCAATAVRSDRQCRPRAIAGSVGCSLAEWALVGFLKGQRHCSE